MRERERERERGYHFPNNHVYYIMIPVIEATYTKYKMTLYWILDICFKFCLKPFKLCAIIKLT